MFDYRLDGRSQSRFKKDIKSGHDKEAKIAVRLCISEHHKDKKWPCLVPSGVDPTGAFIENIKDVNADPDFKINDRFVEITRSDVVCNRSFHQKCAKLDRCIENDYDLVFVNGFDAQKQPMYIRLSGKELESFVIRAKTKYGQVLHPGGGKLGFTCKPALRMDVYWFKDLWKPLPALIEGIPEEYKNILKAAKV